MVKLGTAKHVPIPEFYEETVEIEERAVPGAGSILFFFEKRLFFLCVLFNYNSSRRKTETVSS